MSLYYGPSAANTAPVSRGAGVDGKKTPVMDRVLFFLEQLFVSDKLLSAEAARLAQCRFLQFFGGIRLFFFPARKLVLPTWERRLREPELRAQRAQGKKEKARSRLSGRGNRAERPVRPQQAEEGNSEGEWEPTDRQGEKPCVILPACRTCWQQRFC